MNIVERTIGLPNGEVISYSADDNIMNVGEDVRDIVNMVDSSIITPKWRLFVCFPDDTIDFEIPQEDIVQGGSYSENYQDGQRRTLNFTLYNANKKYTPTINKLWFTTRFRLDQGIELADGRTIWFRKGIFVINNASPSHSNDGQATVSISASDKWSIFSSKTGSLDSTYEIPIGSDIKKVIENIQRQTGGTGFPFDSQPVIVSDKLVYKKTQALISKSAGETYASILLDLATQASAEIFYDSMGQLTLVPTEETTNDIDKPILAHFEESKGNIGDISLSFDMSEVLNKIVVLGSTSNGQYHEATCENTDPDSPTSVERIGARVGNIVSDSNITTDYLAKERAKYELRQQLLYKTTVSPMILFNPLMYVNNMVVISDDFYGMKKQKFLIQSVSASLDYSGVMSLSVSNVKNLGFITMDRSDDDHTNDIEKDEYIKGQTFTVTWRRPSSYGSSSFITVATSTGVPYGTIPKYPYSNPPTISDTAEYTCKFIGWDNLAPLASDRTITAQYSATIRTYKVTWINYDGTVLQEGVYEYGTYPSYTGEKPAHAYDPSNVYTFDGWNSNTGSAKIIRPTTFKARFTKTTRYYTVTWYDGDGKSLSVEQYKYGETPTYKGNTPTKASTTYYNYTFNGSWSPNIVPVAGSVDYVAQFDQSVRQYKITWKSDVSTKEVQESYNAGDTPKPAKQSFTIDTDHDSTAIYNVTSWSPTITPALADKTYTAVSEISAENRTILAGGVMRPDQGALVGETHYKTAENVPAGAKIRIGVWIDSDKTYETYDITSNISTTAKIRNVKVYFTRGDHSITFTVPRTSDFGFSTIKLWSLEITY